MKKIRVTARVNFDKIQKQNVKKIVAQFRWKGSQAQRGRARTKRRIGAPLLTGGLGRLVRGPPSGPSPSPCPSFPPQPTHFPPPGPEEDGERSVTCEPASLSAPLQTEPYHETNYTTRDGQISHSVCKLMRQHDLVIRSLSKTDQDNRKF